MAVASVDQALNEIQSLIQNGKLTDASQNLQRALKQFPQEPNLHNFQGVVEAQRGNHAAAEISFRTAIRLGPRVSGAYLNLGRLYQEGLSHEPKSALKAVEVYERLLVYRPDEPEARYQVARLLCLQGKYRQSLAHIAKLSAASQALPHVLLIEIAAESAIGESAKAEAHASRLDDPHFPLTEADVLPFLPAFGSKKNSIGTKLLERLASQTMLSPQTLRQLASLYEANGDFVRSRQTLEHVIQQGEVAPSVLVDLARTAYLQKDLRGSLGYLAHARDLSPANAQIHFLFGIVCVEQDLIEDAYQSLKSAVELDGNNANSLYALGGVMLQRRSPSEAIPYLLRYSKLNTQDPRGHLALGAAYYQAGQLDSAESELAIAIRQPETSSAAHYYLGKTALARDDLEKAKHELQFSLNSNPQNLDAKAELGLVYLRLKEITISEKLLADVLRQDPDHYKANLHLLNLYQRTKDPRTEEQAKRFEEVKKKRLDREQSLMRRVEFEKN